jgi:hypothetical protein
MNFARQSLPVVMATHGYIYLDCLNRYEGCLIRKVPQVIKIK